MHTSFLNYLLLMILLGIFLLFLYQSQQHSNTYMNNKNNKNKNNFLEINSNIFSDMPYIKMLYNRVGPLYNFHQKFNKYIGFHIKCINPQKMCR